MPKELERYLLPFRATEPANDDEALGLRVAHTQSVIEAPLTVVSWSRTSGDPEATVGVSSLTPPNPLASMIVEHEDVSSMSEAEIYSVRAAELRQEAKQTHWPDVRDRVLALAEEYDLLAKYLQ